MKRQPPHGRRLAICGGGPSLADHLQELKTFDGDIWAINNTAAWLARQGVRSTFLTVDPSEPVAFDVVGVSDAILATLCHPRLRNLFDRVSVFDMIETDPSGVPGGSTSVCRAATLALHQGYLDVTFYGCESSFPLGNDHVDRNDSNPALVVIQAGSEKHITKLEFMLQAEQLAQLIDMAPSVFREKSGGLLRGIVENPETWAVVAVSEALKHDIEARSGKSGLYDQPYQI